MKEREKIKGEKIYIYSDREKEGDREREKSCRGMGG
jgi:hypothetical protein